MKEAGKTLIHDYTDKLWELINIFKGQGAAVMIIADTHIQKQRKRKS